MQELSSEVCVGPLELNLSTAPAIDFTISHSGVEPWKLGLTDEYCLQSTRLSPWQLRTADNCQFNVLLLFYIPLSNLNA